MLGLNGVKILEGVGREGESLKSCEDYKLDQLVLVNLLSLIKPDGILWSVISSGN